MLKNYSNNEQLLLKIKYKNWKWGRYDTRDSLHGRYNKKKKGE